MHRVLQLVRLPNVRRRVPNMHLRPSVHYRSLLIQLVRRPLKHQPGYGLVHEGSSPARLGKNDVEVLRRCIARTAEELKETFSLFRSNPFRSPDESKQLRSNIVVTHQDDRVVFLLMPRHDMEPRSKLDKIRRELRTVVPIPIQKLYTLVRCLNVPIYVEGKQGKILRQTKSHMSHY
jgi:hypothetical protein